VDKIPNGSLLQLTFGVKRAGHAVAESFFIHGRIAQSRWPCKAYVDNEADYG